MKTRQNRHKMGKLKTKSTNSDPVFYDVSSNHHQNSVNICLMMNPLGGRTIQLPQGIHFSRQEAQSLPGRMLRAPTCHRGIQTQPARGFPIAYPAPWKIHIFEPQEWRWVVQMIFLFNWVIFCGFHRRFVGGTYPT